MGQREEGQLYKYTNVMKGWQPRWFVLDPGTGILDYYMPEDTRRSRPRGSVHLANASPHLGTSRDSRQNTPNLAAGVATTAETSGNLVNNTQTTTRAQQRVMCNTRSLYDTFSAAQEILLQAEMNHHSLATAVEELPNTGTELRCTDPDLLLLKATSQATLLCLKQCLGMLQHQQQAASFQTTGVTGGATMELLDPFSYSLRNWSNSASNPDISTVSTPNINSNDNMILPEYTEKIEINSEDEVMDEEENYESELRGSFDDKKIFQLISQLKLGTDLTKVKSPTIILEPFSMLEMYANFMSHPDIFLRIPEGTSAEQRMLNVVEWYLTSFHVGRKGSSIKKPYNPILGELFFCSWDVTDSNAESNTRNGQKLKFKAEQVSHHPLASAFYVENSDKTICMNASVGMKSRFLGMSIAINVIGEAVISVIQHNEDYIVTYPNACARIIVSSPCSELTGKVAVSCNKTGYSASITFHSKPFYGGKFHRITAEVKNTQGDIICKVQGEWNGSLEFVYANGETKVIDTSSLQTYPKCVRPCAVQSEMESRKVWHDLTAALKDGNMKLAAEHKQRIEDCQRMKMKKWKDSGYCFVPRYFQDTGNGENWEYCDHLKHKITST